MRRGGWIGTGLLLAAALLLFGCGGLPGRKETAPEYVFTYAENQTGDYPTTQGAKRFAELLKERSGGRIEIRIYPNAELGDENSTVEQLQLGGIDFVRASLSTVTPLSEKAIVLQMPYLYRDSEHMWTVLNGEAGREVMDSFQDSGAVPLSWYDAGIRNFYTVEKPITCLEDLAGMKIRVQESALMQDMIRALGAIPVPMPYEKVYSALETGVADGAENNWSSYEAMEHYAVSRYYTVDEHMRVPELQLMSQVTWEKLSREDQELIRSCAELSAVYEQSLWKRMNEVAEERVRKKGTEVILLPEEEKERFREAMEPLYEKYCKDEIELLHKIQKAGEK